MIAPVRHLSDNIKSIPQNRIKGDSELLYPKR